MGQLQSLQRELKRLLFIGGSTESSPFWKEGPPARLQVYRNTVHGNAYDTLDSDYPLTMKQFSDDTWFELSEKYFSKNPPAMWELNHCILTFPKFLKSQKVKPWIVELAEYELTDLLTFIHLGVTKKNAGVTNPTVSVRVFHYQIFDWVQALAPADKPPLAKPEVLVFYRDTDHVCHVRKADPLMLLMIEHFRTAGADLDHLEAAREKLLPQNSVPLERVFAELTQSDIILL
jgi:hypothetical protein